MATLIDLTGKQFGDWRVLSRVEGSRPPCWHCRCSCGMEKDVLGDALRRGTSTSCGASIHRKGKMHWKEPSSLRVDVTGQRFGHLTAVSYDKRRRKWLCKCDCGGTTTLAVTYLLDGSRTDCGCSAAKAAGERVKAGASGNMFGTNIYAVQHRMAGIPTKANSSGYPGVRIRRYKSDIVYCARLTVRGKEIYLGQYATLDAAITARKDAEQKYFVPVLREAQEEIEKRKGKEKED